jgi:hypothetical protein
MMAEPNGKNEVTKEDIITDTERRASMASINMNKNLDAK